MVYTLKFNVDWIRFDDCVQGGESILLDTYPILEKMKQQYPKQFNTLTRIPATFQKLHYERYSEFAYYSVLHKAIIKGTSCSYGIPKTPCCCE